MLCYKRTYQSHTKKKVMDFKKINSKSKIGFVIVIIFCMTILLTFFDLGLNFVYNSEKYDKESNTLSQSQLKKNLPFENEYLGYKKKIQFFQIKVYKYKSQIKKTLNMKNQIKLMS